MHSLRYILIQLAQKDVTSAYWLSFEQNHAIVQCQQNCLKLSDIVTIECIFPELWGNLHIVRIYSNPAEFSTKSSNCADSGNNSASYPKNKHLFGIPGNCPELTSSVSTRNIGLPGVSQILAIRACEAEIHCQICRPEGRCRGYLKVLQYARCDEDLAIRPENHLWLV